jgi:hypothetical protein
MAFCHLTKSGERDWSMHLLRLDLETLQTSVHRFHPDPAVLPAAPMSSDDFLQHVEKLRSGAAQDPEAFSRAAIDYLDECRSSCVTQSGRETSDP